MTKTLIIIGLLAVVALVLAGSYVYMQTSVQQKEFQIYAARREDLSMQQQSLDATINNLNAQIAAEKLRQEELASQIENITANTITLTPVPEPVAVFTPTSTPAPAPVSKPIQRRTSAS